jgi:hypothetical protein
MIAFKNNLPLVRFDEGRVMNFEREWLARGLARAAGIAGYEQWWLAEHVTESVTCYLKNDFSDPVVGISRLRTAVQSVLQVIGYADVASHFEPLPPTIRLSLEALAREAGAGYELSFFQLLQVRVRELVDSSSIHAEFCDLNPCVKLLRSAKNWSRDCTGLRWEIVRFIRGELGSRERASELQLQLS